MFDSHVILELIARTGDVIEIAPGVWKTIADVTFPNGSSDVNVLPSSLNDFGRAVLQVHFTDNTKAIIVVPELGPSLYIAAAWVGLPCFRPLSRKRFRKR